MGVFSVRLDESKVTQEERRLIEPWAALAALTLERASLRKKRARQLFGASLTDCEQRCLIRYLMNCGRP